jgi:predicted esterase
MAHLQRSVPHIKFILPTAPKIPVTLNGRMRMTAWHDIKRLDKIADEDFEGLDASISAVRSLIDEECKAGVVTSDKIIVGGFSQGAAMSLLVGYSYPAKLAGVAALSGYLPRHEKFGQFLSEGNKNTPAYIGHGTADQVVSLKAGEGVDKVLSEHNIPHEFKMFKGMPHSVVEEELEDLVKFFNQNIPSS